MVVLFRFAQLNRSNRVKAEKRPMPDSDDDEDDDEPLLSRSVTLRLSYLFRLNE